MSGTGETDPVPEEIPLPERGGGGDPEPTGTAETPIDEDLLQPEPETEQEQEQQVTQQVLNNPNLNQSIPVGGFERQNLDEATRDSDISKLAAEQKRTETDLKKEIFSRIGSGAPVKKGNAGPNSDILFDQTFLKRAENKSWVKEIWFKSGKVDLNVYQREKETHKFKPMKNRNVAEFNAVLEKAREEYKKTPDSQVTDAISSTPRRADAPPPNIPQSVIDSVLEETREEITDRRDDIISDLKDKLGDAESEVRILKSQIVALITEINTNKEIFKIKDTYAVAMSQDLAEMRRQLDSVERELGGVRAANRNLNDASKAKIAELRGELERRQKLVQTKGVLTEKEIQDLEVIFKDNTKEAREDQLTAIADIKDLVDLEGKETFDENFEGRLKGIDKNIESLKEKADASDKGSPRQIIFRLAERASEMTKDYLNMRYGRKLETEAGQEILKKVADTNDLSRFERFKEWARENLGALAAVAISIGGIITTVVVGARSALKRGANALGKLGTALWNAAGKVAPVFGALLGLAAQIISLGAKGVEFLARNLWLLILAISYYLYEEWKDRRTRRRQEAARRRN